jgi:hypothetical protein
MSVNDLTDNTEGVTETSLETTVETMEGEPGEGIQLGPKDMPPVVRNISTDDARNIIFVGKGDAPASIHGAFKAALPDSETQKNGFYHENAREIIAHFPKMYKKFARKGDK